MVITLGEASRQTGKSKSAVLKAIKTGRLSATKDDNGDWRIDPAELFRVYPVNRQPENGENTEVHTLAAVELAILRERCDQLEGQLSDLRQDRDHWRQQATALLTDQRTREQPQEAPRKPVERRLGRAWSILRGRG